MLTISVIICTKNRLNDLIACVNSLITQTIHVSELIIIDSGDVDLGNVFDKYKTILNIRYIRYKAGLTAARNRGIKESTGDVIIFLDDDVILDKNYIYYIHDILINYGKEVGAVSGYIVNDEMRSYFLPNLIRYSIIRKFKNLFFDLFYLYCWGDGKFQPSGFSTYSIDKKKVSFIECLQGSNMVFRREVLETVEFDENLQGYCFMEDCDISYRVAQKYKIIYTPYAKLIHNISSVSRDSSYLSMKMLIENHYYLFKKNFPQTFYNQYAFCVSVVGLFFICLLEMKKENLIGLFMGLKIIIYEKFWKSRKDIELI